MPSGWRSILRSGGSVGSGRLIWSGPGEDGACAARSPDRAGPSRGAGSAGALDQVEEVLTRQDRRSVCTVTGRPVPPGDASPGSHHEPRRLSVPTGPSRSSKIRASEAGKPNPKITGHGQASASVRTGGGCSVGARWSGESVVAGAEEPARRLRTTLQRHRGPVQLDIHRRRPRRPARPDRPPRARRASRTAGNPGGCLTTDELPVATT